MRPLIGGRDPRAEWEQQEAFEAAERTRAERRATAVFDSFIDSCPVPIELYAADGSFLRSNQAAERLLGKMPPPGFSLLEPQGLKRTGLLAPQLKRVLAGTRVETPPTWYSPADIGLPGEAGNRISFRTTVFPLFDSDNTITRIAALYEDVTSRQDGRAKPVRPAAPEPRPSAAKPEGATEDIRELEFRRRKLEQSLRESEERWRSFVENARGYAVLRFTEEGRVGAVSPSISAMWGISADTIIADSASFYAQVVPDDLPLVRKTHAEILESGKWPDQYRFRVLHKNTGKNHWVELRGTVTTALGRRTYDAVVLDITRELEIEQQRVEADASLQQLTGSPVEGIATLSNTLEVTGWSPGMATVTGIRPDEAVGRNITEVYPDFERTGFLAAVQSALREQKTSQHEAFYHDGREPRAGWYRVCAYPHRTGVLLVVRNLTRQYQLELDWRRSETRLQSLLAIPGLVVNIKDRELRYQLVNQASLRMLGVSSAGETDKQTDEDLLKKPVADLLTSHDRSILAGGNATGIEIALPDAVSPESAWYRLHKTPCHDAEGKVVGILTVGWDISKQVLAHQELTHRHRRLEQLLAEHRRLLSTAEETSKQWETPPDSRK